MVAPSVKIENSLSLSQGELIRCWRDVVLGWSGGSALRGMRLSVQDGGFPSLCVACDEPAKIGSNALMSRLSRYASASLAYAARRYDSSGTEVTTTTFVSGHSCLISLVALSPSSRGIMMSMRTM